MLGDAGGNRFLLWSNHFCHVVLPGRIFAGKLTFAYGSNTISFGSSRNKFPLDLEVFKGGIHRNHPLSGFRIILQHPF